MDLEQFEKTLQLDEIKDQLESIFTRNSHYSN